MESFNHQQQAPLYEMQQIPIDLLLKIPTDQLIKYVPCKVCKDRSSGVHYGVITCEGCKGFFRRASEENSSAQCKNGHTGPITKENRNRCKECRLRACREAGMNISIRMFGRMSRNGKANIVREAVTAQPYLLPVLISEAERIVASSHSRVQLNGSVNQLSMTYEQEEKGPYQGYSSLPYEAPQFSPRPSAHQQQHQQHQHQLSFENPSCALYPIPSHNDGMPGISDMSSL